MPTLPVQADESTQISAFHGPWLKPEPTDVPASQALLGINCEYEPGNVSTRFGFTPFWAIAKIVTSLFNWIKAPDLVSTDGNILVLYNKTDSKVQWAVNLSIPAASDLYTVTAEGISVTQGGNQLIIAAFTTQGTTAPIALGAAQARVVGVGGASVYVDKAFLGPLTTKPSLANSAGAGTVTAGLHSVGYVITTRNGFTGRLSPANILGTFDTTSNIIAAGSKKIDFSITATWPTEAEGIQIVMSTVDDPYKYFIVPGLNFAVPGGFLFTITTSIDISDVLLLATATDVTSNQFLLTQDNLGFGPFSPFKVLEYGFRTIYLTFDGTGSFAFYASEPDASQQLTEAYHKRKLPGWRLGTSAFVLRGILYVLGPAWTYAFEDNQGLPSTWPSPTLVDGTIGTPCVMGTTVSASNDWAAVVCVSGLYIFNGQYQDRPISYMVDPDWRRINWRAAQTIRIEDNKDKKEILLHVPLDGASIPTHQMMFDYSNGLDWESIQYSLWSDSAGYSPRGLCVFQNPSTSRMEFLQGAGVAGSIRRQMNGTDDTSPYTDDGAVIRFTWETAPQPDGVIGTMYSHRNGYVRANGQGLLYGTAYSLDRAIAVPWLEPIDLAESSGVEVYRQFYLNAERCSIRFTCGVDPGDFVQLSGYRHLFYFWAGRR